MCTSYDHKYVCVSVQENSEHCDDSMELLAESGLGVDRAWWVIVIPPGSTTTHAHLHIGMTSHLRTVYISPYLFTANHQAIYETKPTIL